MIWTLLFLVDILTIVEVSENVPVVLMKKTSSCCVEAALEEDVSLGIHVSVGIHEAEFSASFSLEVEE